MTRNSNDLDNPDDLTWLQQLNSLNIVLIINQEQFDCAKIMIIYLHCLVTTTSCITVIMNINYLKIDRFFIVKILLTSNSANGSKKGHFN